MKHASLRSCCAILMLSAISAVGCAETSDRVDVSGHVSYQSKPLPKGSITFFPTSGRPASATLSSQGEYAIELEPGDYDVTIHVGIELPPGYNEGDPIPPAKIVLPSEYTTRAKSTLRATVTEVDQQPIDFALE